jgi:UDP-N-acetylglucosamine acyltransferase
MVNIHATALVDPKAELAGDVEVGPFSIVGPGVQLGPGCRLLARVRITGPVSIGSRNVFHPNAAIGGDPQDLQPAAEDGRIEIGDDNIFREAVTVHRPKMPGGRTRIGSRNRFHFASHVGHDSTIGDEIVLCTHAVLGGHTTIESQVWFEGQGGSHQFVTVGTLSWVRSHIPVTEDVPPFMVVDGNHFRVRGVNPRCRSEALERAYEIIWTSGLPRPDAVRALEGEKDPRVRALVDFLRHKAGGRKGRAGEARRG